MSSHMLPLSSLSAFRTSMTTPLQAITAVSTNIGSKNMTAACRYMGYAGLRGILKEHIPRDCPVLQVPAATCNAFLCNSSHIPQR